LEQNLETSTGETADLSSTFSEGFTEDGYPFKGNPSAPVIIEEFSSYQCPFCARYFQESYPQLMLDYVESGQVLYIFRDFPLPSQPQSPVAAEAALGAQPYSAFAQAVDAALSGEAALPPAPAAPAAAPTPATIAPTDDARVLGDLDAPVTIVEFSDYQCPFCARHFQQTWPQLKTDYIDTGRIKYVFKDFPITSIHPEAPKAHEAARCAGDQDAYWALHDRLFLGQEEWAGNQDHVTVFKGYAAELGLDQGAFDACLDGGRNTANVSADVSEGRSLGVTGTPTFFVDGYPLVGAQSIEVFQQAIDLAEKGTLGDALRLSP
jgi:protein-disulfide isomerase